MKAAAEFGESSMAFANLFTVLIFFQAAWQEADAVIALRGVGVWLLAHTIAFGLIAFSNGPERSI